MRPIVQFKQERKDRAMADYKILDDDKSFHLVDEGIEISLGRWTDWKQSERYPDKWKGLGQSGYIKRKIDYERNIVSFSLIAVKSSYEDISRSSIRGEEVSYPFAPEAQYQNVSKERILKVYEIPLRDEDEALVFGDGRKCGFALRKGGQRALVDLSKSEIVGVWSRKRERWMRCSPIGNVSPYSDDLGLIELEMKKMADLQGFVLS